MIEGALWRAVPSLATLHSREPHRSRLIGLRQLFPPPPCHPRRRTLPLLESGRPDRQGTIYTPSRPLMIVTRLPENTRVCSHLVSRTDWYQKTFASIRRGTIRFSSATGGHQPQWTG